MRQTGFAYITHSERLLRKHHTIFSEYMFFTIEELRKQTWSS